MKVRYLSKKAGTKDDYKKYAASQENYPAYLTEAGMYKRKDREAIKEEIKYQGYSSGRAERELKRFDQHEKKMAKQANETKKITKEKKHKHIFKIIKNKKK